MLPEYLKKKVDLVKELSDVYSKYQHNVERIDYVVFKTTAGYDGKREFLIITYVGGGRTIKLCTGNSYSAIASEIANHLDNGYYDQVEFYKETSDPDIGLCYDIREFVMDKIKEKLSEEE